MSFAAAVTPMSAALPQSGAGVSAGSVLGALPGTSPGAANDGGSSSFAGLISLLQQDMAATAGQASAPAVDPAPSADAASAAPTTSPIVTSVLATSLLAPGASTTDTQAANASANANASTLPVPTQATAITPDNAGLVAAVASPVAAVKVAVTTKGAGFANDPLADDPQADAPAPASPDSDPNQTALIASLMAARQPPVPLPQVSGVARTADAAPAALIAPTGDGKDGTDNAAAPATDPATAGAFDNALASATGAQAAKPAVATAPRGDNGGRAANDQAAPAPAALAQATDGKADAARAAVAAAARMGSHIKTDNGSSSAQASTSGLGVQAAPAATPASYAPTTASAVASGDTVAAADVQTPASVMSQTAVQTLSALSVQISKRLSDGNTKFAVELHPADLGRVDVALTIDRDGKVNAHLNFDTPVTAAAFSAHESELRQQLSQAGLNVDSGTLTFSSRDGDGSGGGQNAFMNQQQQSPPNPHQAARAMAAASLTNDAADTDLTSLSSLSAQGSTLALNLIV